MNLSFKTEFDIFKKNMVTIKPINKDSINEIVSLKVGKHQEDFVSTVAESLAQAEECKDTAYPFAIYEDETPVGFIMLGYYEKKHYYTLWKLLIDERYQNKGYGRAALKLGIDYLIDKFNVDRVYTGVSPNNYIARHLYSSFGFAETGVIEDGMIEMCFETGITKHSTHNKKSIVGGDVLGSSETIQFNAETARENNKQFWNTAVNDSLGVISLPNWGAFLPSEDKLNLLGDLKGKTVLEICCGNGRSLKYAAEHGASELCGIDISPEQVKRAKEYLGSKSINANLVCSSMETDCGIPADHFDVVFSVFGIGWTTDLDLTLKRIYSYLKPGGVFVFSWSHPIHKCVSIEHRQYVFSNSYFDESWYRTDIDEKVIMMSNRMLSTFINALADNGFVIEKLVEETDKEKAEFANSDFGRKALMLPIAFIIKAKKAE